MPLGGSQMATAPIIAEDRFAGDDLPWQAFTASEAVSEWDDLALASAERNPFAESWYLLPALENFDPAGDARIFTYRVDGELCGLMPLSREARYEGKPLPHLGNWMHANCFLGTPLVRKGHEEGFWCALLDHADECAGQALFLHLHTVWLGGELDRALSRVCAAEGRQLGIVQSHERAVLPAITDPEAYLAQALSAKRRKDIRRRRRKLEELGAVTVRRQHGSDDLDRWIADFLRLESSGWKGEAASALACNPRTRDLFEQSMREGAKRGALIRFELLLDGQPVAMLVNYDCAPASFGYKAAFDEAYAQCSPGMLLETVYIEQLDRPDIDWCDSCSAPDHPLLSHLWSDRRTMGRISVAIGGPVRRALFKTLLFVENSRGMSS